MTENTLTQEQRRRCIAGVAYRALFSSTTHGVMWVFLWLYIYRVMVLDVHYLPYPTLTYAHSNNLVLTHNVTPELCIWSVIV